MMHSMGSQRVGHDSMTSACHNFPAKEQMSFNFMATVTIHSDFGDKIKSFIASKCPPSICHEVLGPDAMILVFEC